MPQRPKGRDYPPPWRRASTRGLRWGRLVLVLAAAAGWPAHAPAGPRVPVIVERVVDGDTVWVRQGDLLVKVRLLGVDAPERGRDGRPGEPWSRAATRFVRDRLAASERVYLEVAGDREDAHGRTLGFLWLVPAGGGTAANLSELLVRQGLADAIRWFDYPGRARMLRLEAGARRAGRGKWGR